MLEEVVWQRIADYQPKFIQYSADQASLMRAAVALIIREGCHGTECLMMQRATFTGDPWSGQIGFPGGKVDAQDEDALSTAIRETCEEIGFRLRSDELAGTLDDVLGRKINGRYSVCVSPFVFKIDRAMKLKPNYEVADTIWVPFARLIDESQLLTQWRPFASDLQVPAIQISDVETQVLWGLSLNIMSNLFDIFDLQLGGMSKQQRSNYQKSIQA